MTTEESQQAIKAALANGATVAAVARTQGVSRQTVMRVRAA